MEEQFINHKYEQSYQVRKKGREECKNSLDVNHTFKYILLENGFSGFVQIVVD